LSLLDDIEAMARAMDEKPSQGRPTHLLCPYRGKKEFHRDGCDVASFALACMMGLVKPENFGDIDKRECSCEPIGYPSEIDGGAD